MSETLATVLIAGGYTVIMIVFLGVLYNPHSSPKDDSGIEVWGSIFWPVTIALVIAWGICTLLFNLGQLLGGWKK